MSFFLVLVSVVAIGLIGFFIGRQRAVALNKAQPAAGSGAGVEKMHSRPHYHGWWVFLVSALPAILFLAVWAVGTSVYLDHTATARMPEAVEDGSYSERSLQLGMIRSLADGIVKLTPAEIESFPQTYKDAREVLGSKGVALATEGQDYMVPIALFLEHANKISHTVGSVIALVIAIAGLVFGLSGIKRRTRARNNVERIVLWGLVASSGIAILTTIGIVFSVLFQTVTFFQSIAPMDFFFGTVWDPRFAAAGSGGEVGQFGLIPLLAGTLYIAFVAMLFAVPVGLFSAIYMAEYASPRVRTVVKPLLELLAGIPTIVYGFFALITVGPFLRDLSAAIAGGQGFIMAQSVLTAGLVMGVMLIPFVSSLSDDIITSVPRSLRDGSLGLGATRSETIKRVVLPAALPGIVGALLMTASRAIGETMIVVLAAGVAARLTANPFEAMTTITVKIVNQLTGDLEFDSPQTLVAFALGITLFVLTLIMNIFALYIVRKYREQYE
ncbi:MULTISPECIES: phosphate ABC transporter permease subunit PstC [Brucella]|jgi:phosphate transport system permease protein|uniref:phosphate ABC transporter permease subunit PstC n=1 Tax=Brucella TaxID=234 RepID=UPI0007DA65B4|nr:MULTISPECIES: phosphate ABC transporter permease subunit PstC [Brucella]MBK0019949.1 phosphate ABC transporter permease subunit PstC [Ochrobactrum sp. S45]MBK0043311.1 phosphate ABC transporter permease subunit PstC [Ochrobactrum sp. S46]MBO1024761.1 phosphate ABC transporter permease subunit PstC [Ochrobactrum sp. SD129]MQP39908.1 phosphate ABC transporter permease subunit PstC [Ochrobactrum sp. MYb237]ANG98201.1 phosphate ABC transporter permease subunit PstC [Brucella pseudogrignonensis]